MFEGSILKAYLIPRKKHLSRALIGLISVAVISSVVWLTLVFLSVTKGIEKSWLDKLTTLHAPLQITPTQEYYHSYYYLIDTVSHRSCYRLKSISEKLKSPLTNPYDPEIDATPPSSWEKPDCTPQGDLKDPVKALYRILGELKDSDDSSFSFQEHETSCGMLRLKVTTSQGLSSLAQACYLMSFSDQNPWMDKLFVPPTLEDLHHVALAKNPGLPLSQFLDDSSWHEITCISQSLPFQLLPEGHPIEAYSLQAGDKILGLSFVKNSCGKKGIITRQGDKVFWNQQPIPEISSIDIGKQAIFNARLSQDSIERARRLEDLRFCIKGSLHGVAVEGVLPWNQTKVVRWSGKKPTFIPQALTNRMSYFSEKEARYPLAIPKNFYESGVRIGDQGSIEYYSMTPGALQEQRIPIYVVGFYDPGLMNIGHRCLLAPAELIHTMRMTNSSEVSSNLMNCGVSLWLQRLDDVSKLSQKIQKQLEKEGIDHYWKVSTYRDYEFAKDLLQHFQTERYLFTLISLIILVVGCSNVLSFLVILVNDKKKEIGILQALGASKKSIALIFGGAGLVLGLISSFFGVCAGMLTLHYLHPILSFVGSLQGGTTHHPLFLDQSISYSLSLEATGFVFLVTPLLSVIAGLIPAWRACRLSPSQILRSE